MSSKILKATFILGALAAVSAGAASMLNTEENRKKVKTAAKDFSYKANEVIKDLEEEYSDLDKNLNKLSKSREYKEKVEEVATASKEILKQLEVLRRSSTELFKSIKKEAGKSFE